MLVDLIPFVTVFILLGLALLLLCWRFFHVRPGRSLIFSMLLTLAVTQALQLWQQSEPLPELSLFELNVWQTAVILLALATLVRLIKWLLVKLIIERNQIKFPPFLLDITGWIVLIVAALLTLRQLFGFELTGLLVTSTVASAIIGLSLQDTLGNLIAGISLQIETAFTVADWVEIDGVEGQVVSQNWRTLTLLTREDHRVMLTNSSVARSKIINYSRPTNGQIQTMQITLSETYSPNQIKTLLIQAVDDLEGVKLHPRLKAHVISFQDGTVTYGLSYWLDDYSDKVIVRDQVMTRVWFVLHRAHIPIPDPTGDYLVKIAPEDAAERARASRQAALVAALQRLEWLDALNEAQLGELAAGATRAQYTAGETLVTQGDPGDSLFIVLAGSVAVLVSTGDGRSVFASHLSDGDFFGEMSLLTGEARSATVRAVTETEVVLIQKDEFARILTDDPSLLELFVDALDRRQHESRQRLQADLAEREQRNGNGRDDFIQRIRRYLRVPV